MFDISISEADTKSKVFQFGEFRLMPEFKTLFFKQEKLKLTSKETKLLDILVQNQNKIVYRRDILKKIWGDDDYFKGRSMDVYITRLRQKLASDPSLKIVNIHRTGYILKTSSNIN